jgi:hypothetical protein
VDPAGEVDRLEKLIVARRMPHAGDLVTAGWPPLNRRRPARRRALIQQANLLTSDKVAAMFVFHLVSPPVPRAEINYSPGSRIPDLVDPDLVTVSRSQATARPRPQSSA